MPRSFLVAAVATACAALAAPALASPYKITGFGAAESWELKFAAKQQRGGGEKVTEGPVVDITAPIREGLEASANFGRGRISGEPAGDLDAEVAMKWEIIPLKEDGQFALTTEGTLIVPTGTHGLGDGQYMFELPFIFGSRWGRYELRGMLGYAHSLESSDDEVPFGVVGTVRLSDTFKVGAEIAGGAPSNDFRSHKTWADIGFQWEFMPSVELQGRFAHTVHTKDGGSVREAALYLEIGF